MNMGYIRELLSDVAKPRHAANHYISDNGASIMIRAGRPLPDLPRTCTNVCYIKADGNGRNEP